MVASWLVPALMFLVVIVVSLAGLRWIRSEHLEALRSVRLFSGLSDPQLMSILRAARAIEFQPRVGHHPRRRRGEGLLRHHGWERQSPCRGNEMATLGPGSYFGEMAVIDAGPRTATITAVTGASMLQLSPSAFLLRILDREQALARAVSAELCRRCRTVGGDSSNSKMMCRSTERTLDELCPKAAKDRAPRLDAGGV